MLKVSRKAADDLLNIGAYTEKHWGKAQRNRYLDAIDERFRQLAENPDYPTAKDIGAIKPGCFALAVNEHLIIYRKFHYGVRIVRVLGQVMDLNRHL